MSVLPLVIFAAIAVFVIFMLLNKKGASQDREGLVRDILNKDTFAVEFEGGRPTVVKLHGVSPPTEHEMLDEKVYEFLDQVVRGKRVLVKPFRVGIGDVMVAGVYTMAGEYVNGLMVRQGLGRWVASEAANDSELAASQEHARASQLGVWNPAVRQLVEEKMRKQAAGETDDIANQSIDPEDYETKQ